MYLITNDDSDNPGAFVIEINQKLVDLVGRSDKFLKESKGSLAEIRAVRVQVMCGGDYGFLEDVCITDEGLDEYWRDDVGEQEVIGDGSVLCQRPPNGQIVVADGGHELQMLVCGGKIRFLLSCWQSVPIDIGQLKDGISLLDGNFFND